MAENVLPMYLDGKIYSVGALPPGLAPYSGLRVRVAIGKGVKVAQGEVSFLCVVPEKDGEPEKRIRVSSEYLVFEDREREAIFIRALSDAESKAMEKNPSPSASFNERRYPHNGHERV